MGGKLLSSFIQRQLCIFNASRALPQASSMSTNRAEPSPMGAPRQNLAPSGPIRERCALFRTL